MSESKNRFVIAVLIALFIANIAIVISSIALSDKSLGFAIIAIVAIYALAVYYCLIRESA